MAFAAKTKNNTGQVVPFPSFFPAFDVVASLPDATKFEGRCVLLAASTAPGGACLAISDGINWFPILIGTTAIS